MATSKYEIVQPNRTYNDWDTIEQQIKQSGSDIFATKEDLEQVKEMLLNDTYPVGMILCASVAPKIGTWNDITSSFEGRYLRLGANGTLTAESLPKPNISIQSDGGHTHSGSTNSAGAHTHTVSGSRTTSYYVPNGSYYGKDETSNQTTSSNGSHSHTITLDVSGTHTHNINFEGDIYQEGASVQPLGYGIKIWQRVS